MVKVEVKSTEFSSLPIHRGQKAMPSVAAFTGQGPLAKSFRVKAVSKARQRVSTQFGGK